MFPGLPTSDVLAQMHLGGDDTTTHQNTGADPLESEGENPPEPCPEAHAYGPPPTIVRETNFISDENLLAWLATKQDGLYGELRDHMDMSRARSKLMEDLNHIKGLVDRGMDPSRAAEEMGRLLGEYRGTEFEDELNQSLRALFGR